MRKQPSGPNFDGAKFTALERAKWRDSGLLIHGSLRDFQKLTDETFLELQRKYYRPADLVAQMKQRALLKRANRRPSNRPTAPEDRLGGAPSLRVVIKLQ